MTSFLQFCRAAGVEPLRQAQREHVLGWIREMKRRPVHKLDRTNNGLANATMQQRLVAARLFYDYLVEEGMRATNPVGRGQFTPGRTMTGRADRGLLPRLARLPWIPTDAQWRQILAVAREEPVRNRLMFALAYDAGLRREELYGLGTDDLDPAHRTLRIRAETTKSRRERVVAYSQRLTQPLLPDKKTGEKVQLLLAFRGRPVKSSYLNRGIIRMLCRKAGVPTRDARGRITSHRARHTIATQLYNAR